MADLVDTGNDDMPVDRRLRLSIRWRSIATSTMFPDEARADLEIGFFLGARPLLDSGVYLQPNSAEDDPLSPGYFRAFDDDCGLLKGLNDLLRSNIRLDFEDFVEPLFRMVIARDALNATDECAADTDWFDVLSIVYWGGNWNGAAIGTSGPAIRLKATRASLTKFFRDLLDEALDGSVCDDAAERLLCMWFGDTIAMR